MSEVRIGHIKIYWFNDHLNPASYEISYSDGRNTIAMRQDEIERFLGIMNVICEQNKKDSK